MEVPLVPTLSDPPVSQSWTTSSTGWSNGLDEKLDAKFDSLNGKINVLMGSSTSCLPPPSGSPSPLWHRAPGRVEHGVETLVRQRVLWICLGHEDAAGAVPPHPPQHPRHAAPARLSRALSTAFPKPPAPRRGNRPARENRPKPANAENAAPAHSKSLPTRPEMPPRPMPPAEQRPDQPANRPVTAVVRNAG